MKGNSNLDCIFGDDSPKRNPWRQDSLGFAHFAARLWSGIERLRAPHGYVIGVDGRWGSGKSTVLNFVSSYAKKFNEEVDERRQRVELIEFKPWMVSGHQDVVAAYFKVLSEALNDQESPKLESDELASQAGDLTRSVVSALAKMSLAFDPTGGVASGAAETLFNGILRRKVESFIEAPSLQALHDEITSKLAKCQRRFLVIIDDLDRLEDDELRAIMRMVKSVGRFPNIIYLLSYDSKIVDRVLDNGRSGQGRFIEKIVQHEVGLPKPAGGSLASLLERELAFIMPHIEKSDRWTIVLGFLLREWALSPRAVVRLSNAIKFSWSSLAGEFEPCDLIAMEGLRLFSPRIFSLIASNRDAILGVGPFQISFKQAQEDLVEQLKEIVGAARFERDSSLIGTLFPQLSRVISGGSGSGWTQGKAIVNRGVGSVAGYDAYFGMRLSHDHVSKIHLDQIFSSAIDGKRIQSIFESYRGRSNSAGENLSGVLFGEIALRLQSDQDLRASDLLTNSLLAEGEHVVGLEVYSLFRMEPRSQLLDLLAIIFRRFGKDVASYFMMHCVRTSKSLAFASSLIIERARECGLFPPSRPTYPLVDTAVVQRAARELVSRFDDRRLLEEPFFFDIIAVWVISGGVAQCQEWITRNLPDPVFYAKIAKGVLAISYRSNGSQEVYSLRNEPNSAFYEVEELLRVGQKHLMSLSLVEDCRVPIQALVDGLVRLRDGLPLDGS